MIPLDKCLCLLKIKVFEMMVNWKILLKSRKYSNFLNQMIGMGDRDKCLMSLLPDFHELKSSLCHSSYLPEDIFDHCIRFVNDL